MLSLVVPCYNEQDNVQMFFDEVNRAFDGQVDDYELVFVNDGSKDDTIKVLKDIYQKHSEKCKIQILDFSRNFGKEAAMFAGLEKAKGDLVCVIDADLQQRPEVVLEMKSIMDANDELDCVTAYQEKRKEGKLVSKTKSAFYKLINKISEIDFVNGASDFRLMRRSMVDAVISMSEYHRFSKGIFSWVGFNIEYIPYEVAERYAGKSNWNTRKLLKYALEGIVSFSTAPLKLSTITGSISAMAALIYMIFVIIKKLAFGEVVQGYVTIVVLILFLGGVQLFSIGVLGEYLSRMYIQVKNRPIYILKEHLKNENDEK